MDLRPSAILGGRESEREREREPCRCACACKDDAWTCALQHAWERERERERQSIQWSLVNPGAKQGRHLRLGVEWPLSGQAGE